MIEDEHEAHVIQLALDGDADAGREALQLCRAALDAGVISARLAAYLAERLLLIDQALDDADELRLVKKSSGSIRSWREAAIAEALRINKPVGRPPDPLPEWQVPYAAFGALLAKGGVQPEKITKAISEARQQLENKDNGGLDRREAQKILSAYTPMLELEDWVLRHLAAPLLEKLPTYLPQEKRG